MIDRDDIRGSLLGTAAGDALGMPVEGLSHQNVRTYYLGIKEYRDDLERRDLESGQWTDDTQFTFALVRALTGGDRLPGLAERIVEEYLALRSEARRWGPTTSAAIDRLAEGDSWRASGSTDRPTNGAPMRAAPLGAWWAASEASWEEAFDLSTAILGITHRHPASLAAGVGHAYAIARVLEADPASFDGSSFFEDVLEATRRSERELADRSVSRRLADLRAHLTDAPLDLRDLCDGVGVEADSSWPFAVAMMARNPGLVEATLLSGINVGGDADTVGAFLGGLLGGLHGWSAFPAEWRSELEQVDRLRAEADEFAGGLEART